MGTAASAASDGSTVVTLDTLSGRSQSSSVRAQAGSLSSVQPAHDAESVDGAPLLGDAEQPTNERPSSPDADQSADDDAVEKPVDV